jgi:anaerobic ribonucleoside-triphosphate reductase activating protein
MRQSIATDVLGPGRRAVIWVQGCPLRCPSCLAPESWDPAGGETVTVAALAAWLLDQAEIEGLTFSGGEPFCQAAALVELLDIVQQRRDLTVMCYSGYTLEEIQQRGDTEMLALLSRLDLLVDGPYLRAEHADLRWRASRNQRLIALSDRYRELVAALMRAADRGAGLQFTLAGERLAFSGIPPEPGFRAQLARQLRQLGIKLKPREEQP